MSINKISNDTLAKLKSKSIKGMAINPSERGASPKQIQNAMTEPYIGEALSLFTEINRIVDELNDSLTTIEDNVSGTASDLADAITEYRNGLQTISNNLDIAVGLIYNAMALKQDIANLYDGLDSSDSTKYLSAKQGKVLHEDIATRQTTANLYDGLDSNDATKYLSAKQGKVLKEMIDGKNKGVNYDSIPDMISSLNSANNTYLSKADNIYILDVDVPDFWVVDIEDTSSSYTYTTISAFLTALNTTNYIQIGYYVIAKLETEKVDLSDYQPKGDFNVDSTTTSVNHTYELNKEKSYSNSGITAISLTIPSTIGIGFYSGCNIKVGSSVPTFAITNNSSMPLKIIQLGVPIESYTPQANTTIATLIYNDGINTYLQINEVM